MRSFAVKTTKRIKEKYRITKIPATTATLAPKFNPLNRQEKNPNPVSVNIAPTIINVASKFVFPHFQFTAMVASIERNQTMMIANPKNRHDGLKPPPNHNAHPVDKKHISKISTISLPVVVKL